MTSPRATDTESARLAERSARSAARDNDPRELWPGLDARAFHAVSGWIVRTAQIAAGGGTQHEAPPADAATTGRAAFRLAAGPLLSRWIALGQVAAPAPVAAVLDEHLAHARRRSARLAREATAVIAALRENGVTPVLLKGFDSARCYPDPDTRPFQDVDVLIQPADLARAEAVLGKLGFTAGRLRQNRRRDWTAPGSRLHSLDLPHEHNPWGVDVHVGLGRVFHRALVGELPPPPLAACPLLDVAGTAVHVLPSAHRLALLALHASASLRLLQVTHLLDLAYAARATPAGDTAWPELLSLVRAAGSGRFVYTALSLAERFAPGSVPPVVIAALEREVHGRLVRATRRLPLGGLTRPDRFSVVYAFMWAATPLDAVRVLWQQLMPGSRGDARRHLREQRRLVGKLLRGEIGYGLSDGG